MMPAFLRPICLVLGTCLSLTALVGCGDSGTAYEHATVHGKVTYAGKPVTFGSVLFLPVIPPQDGLIQPASGDIQPDGTYTLKSEKDSGAILGDHKVMVIAVEGDKPVAPVPDAAPSPSKSRGNVQFKSAVPKKYADPESTPLVRTVKLGDNTVDLDLAD